MEITKEGMQVIVKCMKEDAKQDGIQLGKEQGLEQGIREGVSRELAKRRKLVSNLAQLKFGLVRSSKLATMLARIDDSERLDQFGNWILECDTASQVLQQNQKTNGSASSPTI